MIQASNSALLGIEIECGKGQGGLKNFNGWVEYTGH